MGKSYEIQFQGSLIKILLGYHVLLGLWIYLFQANYLVYGLYNKSLQTSELK